MFFTEYDTGLVGRLFLASEGDVLAGCWFDNDRFFGDGILDVPTRNDGLPLFLAVRTWLDLYFSGETPDPREIPLAPAPSEFQALVRQAMLDVPYGETTTYGAIARRLATQTGRRQSAQAVGGAVGRNPMCVIVPCHRVLGSRGNLTGFGGGLDTKVALLEHEHAMRETFRRPKRGGALNGTPNASAAWLG